MSERRDFHDFKTGEIVTMEHSPGGIMTTWREVKRLPSRVKRLIHKLKEVVR